MDWIKDNKFLAGFAAFTIVGTLALGYLLVTGWLNYSSAFEEYRSLAGQNDALAAKAVYPRKENLEAEERRVSDYEAKVKDLRSRLLARQGAIEDIDVDRFPVLLKNAYDTLIAKAKEKNFSLPEGFYFGMERYKEGVPLRGAVDKLGFQLSAIEHLTNLLIDSGATGIDAYIERVPMLSESEEEREEDPRRSGAKPKPARRPAFSGGEVPYLPDGVLERFRLTLQFTAQPDAMVDFFNEMSNDSDYFYWLRFFRVENESKDGKSREEDFQPSPVDDPNNFDPDADLDPIGDDPVGDDPGVDDPGADPAEMDPSAFDPGASLIVGTSEGSGAMYDARVLFGDEQVRVLAVIDIVRFAEPPEDEKKKAPRSEEPSGDS